MTPTPTATATATATAKPTSTPTATATATAKTTADCLVGTWMGNTTSTNGGDDGTVTMVFSKSGSGVTAKATWTVGGSTTTKNMQVHIDNTYPPSPLSIWATGDSYAINMNSCSAMGTGDYIYTDGNRGDFTMSKR